MSSPHAKSVHIPVEYDDSQHRYFLGTDRYTSATQLVEQFIQPFDVEERSMYMADRYGNTPEYWKQLWREGNSHSLKRGNLIHNDQEEKLYKAKFVDYNPVPLPVHNLSVNSRLYNEPLINLEDGVYPEMKLWRHDCRIAGRSDKVTLVTTDKHRSPIIPALFVCSSRSTRIAHVGDYKTNKVIRTMGYQDSKTMKTRRMMFPLGHIEDANFWHYALQLSTYQYMLEYHGFYPGNRTIIHFPHPTDEFPHPKPVTYELPYLREEVKLMIKHNNYGTLWHTRQG